MAFSLVVLVLPSLKWKDCTRDNAKSSFICTYTTSSASSNNSVFAVFSRFSSPAFCLWRTSALNDFVTCTHYHQLGIDLTYYGPINLIHLQFSNYKARNCQDINELSLHTSYRYIRSQSLCRRVPSRQKMYVTSLKCKMLKKSFEPVTAAWPIVDSHQRTTKTLSMALAAALSMILTGHLRSVSRRDDDAVCITRGSMLTSDSCQNRHIDFKKWWHVCIANLVSWLGETLVKLQQTNAS